MEEYRQLRYRIGVSKTSTGKFSYETTVELIGGTMEEVLERSDQLIVEMESRYGIPEALEAVKP